MSEIVSMDLGSNSFRVLKYDCKNNKIVSDFHKVVGLANGLAKTGNISSLAKERLIEAILEAKNKINFDPSKVVAVTTAAMRKAKNNREVLKYIEDKTSIKFKIIDGQEEARLTLLAVKYALKRENIQTSKFVLLDIGGGSTEIIVNDDEKFYSKSFDFGIVTMSQKYENIRDLKRQLEMEKSKIKEFLLNTSLNLDTFTFVATAGTPTTIAAIKLGQNYFSYDRDIINGTLVQLNDLEKCLNILKNSKQEELIKLVGKGRVEFIEVGIYIYKAIFEVLNKNQSLVLDDGLREGVAINACLEI